MAVTVLTLMNSRQHLVRFWARARKISRSTISTALPLYIHVLYGDYVCVCVCVCARARVCLQMAVMFMKIDTNCDGTVDWVSV